MLNTGLYQLLADAILVMHVSLVLFVVGGLMLIVVGKQLAWGWVNGWWFRVVHLVTVVVVVFLPWVGLRCPLTTLEVSLRAKAGLATYSESFVEHWLQRLLFFSAPTWVFILAYSIFGLLVVLVWWRFPPKRNRHGDEGSW